MALNDMPADPDPEGTVSHGCRIGGRMNWLQKRIEAAEAERDALIGLDAASVDEVLVRWDQTEPAILD